MSMFDGFEQVHREEDPAGDEGSDVVGHVPVADPRGTAAAVGRESAAHPADCDTMRNRHRKSAHESAEGAFRAWDASREHMIPFGPNAGETI